jgi:hypothetical protein
VIMKRTRAPPQVVLWTCRLVGFSPSDPVAQRDTRLWARRLVACTRSGVLPEIGKDFLRVT